MQCRQQEVVGSKDTCPHKKGKVMRHNCRVPNMIICSSLLQMNLHGHLSVLSLTSDCIIK